MVAVRLLLLGATACAAAVLAGGARADVQSEWWLQAVDAPAVWPQTEGDGVVVADVDSGADASHPDLAGALLPGVGFADGAAATGDVFGHGTYVAGLIAARGVGALPAGVAPRAAVLPLKISDGEGSSSAAVAAAIAYAARRPDVRVINLSLGGEFDEAPVAAAVRLALAEGKLVVAAAGNMGIDVEQHRVYPCDYRGVLCVAASGPDGSLAWWSNYSSGYVAVAAPGVGITSTWPGGGTEVHDGTSLAAPIVSGVAALLFALRPDATAAQVREAIVASVRPVASLYGYVGSAGVVDAAAAAAALERTVTAP